MGIVNVHNIVGTLVVLAFVLLTVLYAITVGGRRIAFTRALSGIAAGLLLLQYVLGFVLLGGGNRIDAIHYVIALLAIVPVGLEHGYAGSRDTPRARAVAATIAAAATSVLVIVAYIIGSTNRAG